MSTQRIQRLLLVLVFIAAAPLSAQLRTELQFPDVKGYKTVAADLHMHTVFSDAQVWPVVRVREAWRNGLDALAITDHLEYLPFKLDVIPGFNRPYEIAKPEAEKMGLLLIRGAEITRSEPHGHFNAIFLDDCDPLATPDQKDAVKAAFDQGAFIWWNHPEWKRDDGKAWSEIQQDYFDLGWMHGLEVFNGHSYYENAHQWALDNNLTIMGNTDVHAPIDETYNYAAGEHRTMTLIFAEDVTAEALKEALFDRRTVAFGSGTLVGREMWLRPLIEGIIHFSGTECTLPGKNTRVVKVYNQSDIALELEYESSTPGVVFPKNLSLAPGKSLPLSLRSDGTIEEGTETIEVVYNVKNALVAPKTPLALKQSFKIKFTR